MSTYIQVQDQLADEIRPGATAATIAGGVTQAQLKTAILNAVRYYERRLFYFNQKTATFSTVKDQEYYSSTDLADIANLIQIQAMKVTVNGSKLNMAEATFGQIDADQDGAVKSFPKFYAYFKQNLRFFPIPDAVYTITMAHHYRLAALSADADTNVWTTEAEEMIRNRARAGIAANKLRNDNMAARAKAQEIDALDALLKETRLRLHSGLLRVDAALVAGRPFNINLG